MKARKILIVLGVLIFAFVTGWAFQAYLAPEAAVDFVNRVVVCF